MILLQKPRYNVLDRLTNYVFGLILIFLFVLEGKADDHALILSGLALSILLAYVSFWGNWITLDATKAVIVLGTIILGFGGWLLALATIFFFVSSSLLTRNRRLRGIIDREKKNIHHDLQKRRDGYQVWANGFWMAVFVTGWFLFSWEPFLIASFAVVATAAADTWATELGSLNSGDTRKITTFESVEAGTDGGVSVKGTVAALLGSAAVALFVLFFDLLPGFPLFLIVLTSGFLGCVADSYLGAFLQTRNLGAATPKDFFQSQDRFKNSLVNWTSTGIGGIIALFFTQIFLL